MFSISIHHNVKVLNYKNLFEWTQNINIGSQKVDLNIE